MQSLMGTWFVHKFAEGEVRERLLGPALRGEVLGTICMTEPDAGSDLFAISTRAEERDGTWFLTGQKTWITQAPVADMFTVFARTGEKELSIFLVEKGAAGLTVGRNIEKMGVRASVTSEVFFENTPATAMFGERGAGTSSLREILAEIRLVTAALALGVGRAAYEDALAYAHERKQFGKPIAKLPGRARAPGGDGHRPRGGAPPDAVVRVAQPHRPPQRNGGEHGQALRVGGRAPDLRPRGARARELRVRHGLSDRALPARRALHAHRRRHIRDPENQHRAGTRTVSDRPVRVLIAKPGLDGHDVGAKLICRALMDAGMEVIYTGLRQSPAAIAKAAAEENVDVVGLSILSGAYLPLCRKVKAELGVQGADALLIVGGNIPKRDHAALGDLGVDGVFPTGTPFETLVEFVRASGTGTRD